MAISISIHQTFILLFLTNSLPSIVPLSPLSSPSDDTTRYVHVSNAHFFNTKTPAVLQLDGQLSFQGRDTQYVCNGELLKMSEDKFGYRGDGPVILPCDAAFLDYALSMLRSRGFKDAERELFSSLLAHHCSASSSLLVGDRQQLVVSSF